MTKSKGLSKRASGHFKKGHSIIPPNTTTVETEERPIVRLEKEEYTSVVESSSGGEILTRDSVGQPVPCMILRPKEDGSTYLSKYDNDGSIPEGDNNTHMLVHRGKILDLFNSAFKAHKNLSPNCPGDLKWEESSMQQRGLCWSAALECDQCAFLSDTHKLYNEIESGGRGRKAAAPNVGLQIGLARQGISNTGFSDILHATNTVAPSTRGMQKTANQISGLIENVNRQDMTSRIEKLQVLNEKRGLSKDAGIAVEGDGMYNNRLSSGFSKTPMQPATRATFLLSENVTRDKQVISTELYSKLCSCPGKEHRGNCTANIPMDAVIGDEGRYLKEAVEKVSSGGGPPVNAITIDGDSNANAVARGIAANVFTCTTHLTRRSCAKFKNANFSDSFLPGRVKAEKEKFQSRFAMDISKRCQAEIQEASKACPGDLAAIMRKLEFVPDAIIACYTGNHNLCHEHSLVCKRGQPWNRPFLIYTGQHQNAETTFLTPTKNDIKTLKECLAMRFSFKALERTYLNRTQNKSEANNRALTKSLPKHLEFRRNASGRAHAAVHSLNNQPGTSLVKLCEAAGSPISRRSRVVQQLQKTDRVVKSHKRRQGTAKYKSRRAELRNDRYARYDHKQHEACYKKGGILTQTRQADYDTRQARRIQGSFTSSVEHAYAKNTTLESINVRKSINADHSY